MLPVQASVHFRFLPLIQVRCQDSEIVSYQILWGSDRPSPSAGPEHPPHRKFLQEQDSTYASAVLSGSSLRLPRPLQFGSLTQPTVMTPLPLLRRFLSKGLSTYVSFHPFKGFASVTKTAAAVRLLKQSSVYPPLTVLRYFLQEQLRTLARIGFFRGCASDAKTAGAVQLPAQSAACPPLPRHRCVLSGRLSTFVSFRLSRLFAWAAALRVQPAANRRFRFRGSPYSGLSAVSEGVFILQ